MFLEDPQTPFLSCLVATFKTMLRNESISCKQLVTIIVTTVTSLVGIVTTTDIPACHDRNSLQVVNNPTGMKKAIPEMASMKQPGLSI
jgi:hypothetical protein